MYVKTEGDMQQGRENNSEESRERSLQETSGEEMEEMEEREETFFDKETGHWEGTGKIKKIKPEDPDEYRDNEESR